MKFLCSFLILFISLEVYSFPGNGRSHGRPNISSGVGPGQTTGNFCVTGNCAGLRNNLRREGLGSVDMGPNMAEGAMRSMAIFFRSCEAGSHPLTEIRYDNSRSNYLINQTASNGSAPYNVRIPGYGGEERSVRTVLDSSALARSSLYGRESAAGSCRAQVGDINVAQTGKYFGFGSALRYNRSSNQVDPLFCGSSASLNALNPLERFQQCNLSPISQPGISVDCAEFVAMSALGSCLKFSTDPNQDILSRLRTNSRGDRLSTSYISSLIGKSGSCLQSPQVSPQNPLAAGDVLVGGGRHAAVVTSVGRLSSSAYYPNNDPLGIAAAARSRNCNSIDPSKFNMSLAHSSGRASLGPVHSTVGAFHRRFNRERPDRAVVPPYPIDKIYIMARAMCLNMMNNRPTSGSASSLLPGVSLARHKGTPECRHSPDQCPRVNGDDCAERCFPRGR